MATPRLVNAEFMKSAQALADSVDDTVSEVVFLGRSNVGKSSLINAIANQKALARTSNTPGRTQLINFFVDGNKTLVDLPGYGYAKMSKSAKNKMFQMIEEYFNTREQLLTTFLLIDTKIGPTEDDLQMIEYLKGIDRKIFIVLTKSDKAKQSEKHKTKQKIEALNVEYLLTSSSKRINIKQLQDIINSHF